MLRNGLICPIPFSETGEMSAGRLLNCTFRSLLGVHSSYGLHACRVTKVTLTGGFSGFVSSPAALIATGQERSSYQARLSSFAKHVFTARSSEVVLKKSRDPRSGNPLHGNDGPNGELHVCSG
jgi:hypothetical protein